MSLEGTIRDLGLQEVGQLLSLSRKHGTLRVSSLLRGEAAWIRFSDGAIVDAGSDEPTPPGSASQAASAGNRSEVAEAALDVLSWREGHFAFVAHDPSASHGSCVRISTDAMLVESAQREDAWSVLRDRIPSSEAVPAFVDVEPKSLPLLRLQPQEWEVLTHVYGERSVRTLARLMQRDLLDVAAIVHGLVGNGLLVVTGPGVRRSITPVESEAQLTPSAGYPVHTDSDLDDDDLVFDPVRAGMLTPHGTPRMIDESPRGPQAVTVAFPATTHVASEGAKPSLSGRVELVDQSSYTPRVDWRADGDAAARRGDFEQALSCWSAYLRTPHAPADADQVREAIGLAARLQALLYPVA